MGSGTATANHEPFSAVRAICIGAMLLVVGTIWVIVQELVLNAGDLNADSPSVGCLGLFMAVVTVSLLL